MNETHDSTSGRDLVDADDRAVEKGQSDAVKEDGRTQKGSDQGQRNPVRRVEEVKCDMWWRVIA